jgi:hypothetical protein
VIEWLGELGNRRHHRGEQAHGGESVEVFSQRETGDLDQGAVPDLK